MQELAYSSCLFIGTYLSLLGFSDFEKPSQTLLYESTRENEKCPTSPRKRWELFPFSPFYDEKSSSARRSAAVSLQDSDVGVAVSY